MSSQTRGGSAVPGAGLLLGGRYRLDRPIGRGGMAQVWAARDEVLDRPVAVKLLSARFHDDPDFQQRFRREAQQAAALNHPNIVAVYDTGEHDGLPFIVMELVQGRSLQQIMAHGGLTEERALEVCAEVCSALAYAHSRGIIHRDIKPGNILIDDNGDVKVTDLGIARAIDAETVTQTAAVLGTAAYLSPEQAQGARLDASSDIYSLGIVLYEMLSGRPPFQGDSAVGVAYQHVQEQPRPPRERNPDVSPAAEAIAMKAVAKNPANRYASAQAMRDDLVRAHAGESVEAPAVLLPDDTAVIDSELAPRRPPPTATQQRRRRTLGYLALGIFTVLAFAGGLWLLASLLSGDATLTRTVPRVIGEPIAIAYGTLEAYGLTPRTAADGVYHDTIPDGHVVDQDPAPGDEVEDGAVVVLTVSRGVQPVTVPNVAGSAEEDAIATIREAGLSVGDRVKEFSDEVPSGRVIGTDPPGGERVPKNSTVTLIVSAGQETEIVPNVVRQTESEARFQLEEREFKPLVVREFDPAVDRGRVIRQNPDGNQPARKGSEVTIVVSEGPQEPPTPSPSPSPTPTPSPSPSPTEAVQLPVDPGGA
ncbi:MAG: Stk1 family PASTA domain-containing Ser/Thr kinase [Actinobacteria bacterium]|nr:Stk1 family PASTA domain-containing Ser/Thr kinase [Actinomycetota bacterium]